MSKIRSPRPLNFLRRRATRTPVQLPKVAVPLLFVQSVPCPAPVAMEVKKDAPPSRSGFVL